MGRVLCIDYGTRRTGVALSDPTRTIAGGLPTIEHAGEAELLAALRAIANANEVEELVIGLPLGRAGNPSARSRQVAAFARRLAEATGLPVHTIDERGSSRRADSVLEQTYGGTSRKSGRRRNVDKVAATLLLQEYLDR